VFVAFLLVMFAVVLILVLISFITAAAGMPPLRPGQAPPAWLVIVLVVLTVLVFAVIQLVFPVAAVETGNPIRLLTRSWELARAQYLRLLAFIVIMFVGLGLAAFAAQLAAGNVVVLLLGPTKPGSLPALVVGLVNGLVQAALTVVTATMLARIYVQLAGRGDPQAGVSNSGI
jgi:hypothetical protein